MSVKISELAALAGTAVGDQVIINDISEALDINKTKYITVANLVKLVTQVVIQSIVPSQAAGDLLYADSTTVLTRLAKSANVGEVLKQAAGSVPVWAKGAQLLDWGIDDDASFTSTTTAAWQSTGASVTLSLPVAGIVVAIATGNIRQIDGNGYYTFFSSYIDGENGNSQRGYSTYYEPVASIHIKSCAAGNRICRAEAYGYSSNRASVANSRIAAFAFPT